MTGALASIKYRYECVACVACAVVAVVLLGLGGLGAVLYRARRLARG